MQTPLQELIDYISDLKNVSSVEIAPLDFALEKAKSLLEKEKQMVIYAWKNEREIVFFDLDKDELSEKTKQDLAETYYNETYNAELPPTK